MKALSIKQPWLWAITDLDKRVENRTWRPPADVIGERIALHAGKTSDWAGYMVLYRIIDRRAPSPLPHGAIVATATVMGWVSDKPYENCCIYNHVDIAACLEDRWYFGPFGWLLDEVRKLPEPIPCRGWLGLWDVPLELLEMVKHDGS